MEIKFDTNVEGKPGRPDLWLTQHGIPVFVHGCFWHRHDGCKKATTPKRNREFWLDKFDKNVERDARNLRHLQAAGHPAHSGLAVRDGRGAHVTAHPESQDFQRATVAMTTVRERFALEAERIVRNLSIDGAHGTSTAAISVGLPTPSSQDDLLSEWDRAFLAGKIKYAGRDAERAVGIVDVFCGAGGLSYGVREAIRACGLRPQFMLAVDTDPVKIEVYRRNFDPKHFSTQDLWHSVTKSYSTRGQLKFLARPQLLTDELQAVAGNVDVLLGGPPCEGHSTSNNVTRRDDPRNKYYIVMPALAVALDAGAVVIENVPGIRNDRGQIPGHREGAI